MHVYLSWICRIKSRKVFWFRKCDAFIGLSNDGIEKGKAASEGMTSVTSNKTLVSDTCTATCWYRNRQGDGDVGFGDELFSF